MSRPLTSEGEEWAQEEEEGYPEGMDEGESGSAEKAKGAKNAKDTDSANEAPEAKGTKKVKKAPVVTSEGEERPTKRRSLDGGKYYTYDEFRDWWEPQQECWDHWWEQSWTSEQWEAWVVPILFWNELINSHRGNQALINLLEYVNDPTVVFRLRLVDKRFHSELRKHVTSLNFRGPLCVSALSDVVPFSNLSTLHFSKCGSLTGESQKNFGSRDLIRVVGPR